MTAALANDLRVFAGQKWPTMNHKWRKNKLASMLRMSERRVKSIYEADPAARVRADEAERIRALINQEEADAALADRIAELEAQVAYLVAAISRDEMASAGTSPHQSSNGGTGESQGMPRRRATD